MAKSDFDNIWQNNLETLPNLYLNIFIIKTLINRNAS